MSLSSLKGCLYTTPHRIPGYLVNIDLKNKTYIYLSPPEVMNISKDAKLFCIGILKHMHDGCNLKYVFLLNNKFVHVTSYDFTLLKLIN